MVIHREADTRKNLKYKDLKARKWRGTNGDLAQRNRSFYQFDFHNR